MTTKLRIETEEQIADFRAMLKQRALEQYPGRELEVLININKNLPNGFEAVAVFTDGKGREP